jgi:hypothetical protein
VILCLLKSAARRYMDVILRAGPARTVRIVEHPGAWMTPRAITAPHDDLQKTWVTASKHRDDSDHIVHLFDRFQVSHILPMADTPMRLPALSLPRIAAAPRTELELVALKRMVRLMGKADA